MRDGDGRATSPPLPHVTGDIDQQQRAWPQKLQAASSDALRLPQAGHAWRRSKTSGIDRRRAIDRKDESRADVLAEERLVEGPQFALDELLLSVLVTVAPQPIA